jgi:hypothetical protein
MINFRYHLVSIIAVFLALALGIAMGATVISQGIVDTLRDRINNVEDNADAANAENTELSDQIGNAREYMEATAPYVVAGQLDQTAVVVVAARGVDADAVERTVELTQSAGADAPGILWLEQSFALDDPDQVEQMAEILGRPVNLPRGVLRRDAWNALAQRLAAGPPPYDEQEQVPTAPDGGDLLIALEDDGFIGYQSVGDVDSELVDLPEFNARALLIDGTDAEIPPDDVVARGAMALLRAQFPLVVAEVYADHEDGPDRGERVAPIRDDDELADDVSTVDDLDLEQGRITVVLVLSDPDTVGHYGYGIGSDDDAPEFPDS